MGPVYHIGAGVLFTPVGPDGVHELRVLGELVRIGSREARLLGYFCANSGKDLSFQEIAANGFDNPRYEKTSISQGVKLVRSALHKAEPKAIATVRSVGYRFVAPVQRIDKPLRTRLKIFDFDMPQQSDEALFHGVGLRDQIAHGFFAHNISLVLDDADAPSDYAVKFVFVTHRNQAKLTMRLYRAEETRPICVHVFELSALDDAEMVADLVLRVACFLECEVLVDKWRLFSEVSADWNEQTIEAMINPLYTIVDEDGEELGKVESFLDGLRYSSPNVAQLASAVMSILYGLWARQTIDYVAAAERNLRAFALAQEAMAIDPSLPLAELAYARSQRLDGPHDNAANERDIECLERVVAAAPGNVLARVTLVSAKLDQPDRFAEAAMDAERLAKMYPHDPALSMAMTTLAKARVMNEDVVGARRALEAAVSLAERASKTHRAPPYLRFMLAVFYKGSKTLLQDAKAQDDADLLAHRTYEKFLRENPIANRQFDGAEFALRQLHRAPDWMKAVIAQAAADLKLEAKQS